MPPDLVPSESCIPGKIKITLKMCRLFVPDKIVAIQLEFLAMKGTIVCSNIYTLAHLFNRCYLEKEAKYQEALQVLEQSFLK